MRPRGVSHPRFRCATRLMQLPTPLLPRDKGGIAASEAGGVTRKPCLEGWAGGRRAWSTLALWPTRGLTGEENGSTHQSWWTLIFRPGDDDGEDNSIQTKLGCILFLFSCFPLTMRGLFPELKHTLLENTAIPVPAMHTIWCWGCIFTSSVLHSTLPYLGIRSLKTGKD